MTFTRAISSGFENYTVFRGRAARSEYWYWTLFSFLVAWGAYFVDGAIGSSLVSPLASLALFLPGIAVTVRRLHDTDRSGGWFWICLVPIVGWIILIVFLATEGTPEANRFG
ncbi:inner membrane protein YhaI [mine drainage metagenome]|uniref:Inner membrane protein YhaI n=1 Tax=mine drainage metagenome TaxID=410659 RepID=A0A1J5Q1G1_9ZZZZ